MNAIHDVLIVGAGPVGLFLAGELRLAGVSVLVLEQAEDQAAPLKRLPFGLRGLSWPSIEALRRRGLLDAVAASADRVGKAAHWMNQTRRSGGHFAGIPFYRDRIDASAWPDDRRPGMSLPLPVELEHVERVLAARAVALGAEIRRGRGVEGLDHTADGVTVWAGDAPVQGRWLVGCDGGRSTVRRAGGFDFVGTDPEFTGYSAAVVLADPDGLPPGRHHTPGGMYSYAPPGTLAMVDFDRGAFHRTRPVTPEHVQAVLRRVSGTDVTVAALQGAATWTDRACQATTYRRGRVLLAGDAAHIHSPLGGQGLNLGFGDAINLGWKLAATVRGDAPDDLLGTYTSERHPVGAQVLDWSRAQVALMRPDRATRALAAVMRDLVETQDGATYVASRVWGLSLRYDLGDGHPGVGRSVPEIELGDGTTLGGQLATGRGLVVDLGVAAPLKALAGRWGDRIDYVASPAGKVFGASALLLRPDGIVAWAGDDPHDTAGFRDAASRWFGRPEASLAGAIGVLSPASKDDRTARGS